MEYKIYYNRQIWMKTRKPDEKDYKVQKITMSRLVPNGFLPYTLVKWLQKSHNMKIWSMTQETEK